MSTDLANLGITPGLSREDFNKIATSNRFLPRIKLMQSGAAEVAQRKAQAGELCLVVGKDKFEKFGDSFDCLPIQVRAHAMDFSDRAKIINSYDMNSKLFEEIKERSKTQNSNCAYGPEFLIWLPEQQKFATFFFANPTMRGRAGDMINLLLKPATVASEFIPSKQYGGWFAPVIIPCSTPFELPSTDEIMTYNGSFSNPSPDEETELAEEAVTDAREH